MRTELGMGFGGLGVGTGGEVMVAPGKTLVIDEVSN